MEIFENYDNGLKNAQLFKIYRDIFKLKDESRKFNNICNKIIDDILKILEETNLETLPRYESLPNEAKKTFFVKIQKTKLSLEKRENRYKFNDWLKQIIINLLYADETFKWIKYSRDSNDFNKDGYYYKLLVHFNDAGRQKDAKLYYYTFLFIIDSLNFLAIIEHKIGFYDRDKNEGMESRLVFSEYGRSLFSEIKEDTIFETILDQDLIIKTERIPKKGNGDKIFTKIVKYIDSVDIRRKKEFIKKVNSIYNELKLTVKIKDAIHEKVSFVDDLWIYKKNNSIDLKELNCEIKDSEEVDNGKNTTLKYYDKFASVKDNSISITDKRRSIYEREISTNLSLLMQNCKFCNSLNDLYPRSKYADTKENDLLKINKMCFEINKKSMFRVYSRNSWMCHGRWYGGL